MLLGFILVFLGYLWLSFRPGRFVSMLRYSRILFKIRLGLDPVASYGTLLGNYSAKEAELIAKGVNEALGPEMNFSIRIFKQPPAFPNSGAWYAITLNIWLAKDNCASEEKLSQYVASLRQQLKEQLGIQLRQFGARNEDFDLRAYSSGSAFGEPRIVSRRARGPQAMVFEVTR